MSEQARRVKLTDLKPDLSNANRGTERGLKSLDDSLSQLGLGRSIVVDKNLNVIGGNKTLERAIDRGFEDAILIPTQGDKLVVVVREDLDLMDNDPNNRARKLAYADNRVGQLDISWDTEQLLADLQAGFNFDGLFFDWELDNLLGSLQEPFDPEKEWQGMPEFEQGEIKPFHSIKVHFKTEEDLRAFAQLMEQTVTDKTTFIYYPKQERENLQSLEYEVE